MCSLNRSTSTSPGISRSPVNSAKLILQLRLRSHARIDFYPARKMHVPIDLRLRPSHLERDRIVDPVAHLISHQSAISDCGREGEGRGIELRKIEVKIHRDYVTGLHGREFISFTR